ncbi:efflux RND transporter periplasmic adaptor subunit [Colwellia asteriadis]|uniref:efflux RND transporter periplasmic adaptor subunit n=1 Tax=Colwellia asteriadis TaxID=517723 RepID=UPI0031D5366D
MKKFLGYLTCSLLIYCFFSNISHAQSYKVNAIKAEPFIYEINRTGKLAFKRTLNLSFKTSGFLEELNVDEGDRFSAGQILAELDAFELIAEKNSTYASLLQAKQNVQRTELLLAKKLSSQQALDNAKTAVETTRARYKVAQYNLTKAQLIAPFNGVVLRRFTELGELQNPSQTALQLAALTDNLVARVTVTTNEIGMVTLNQKVNVNLTPYGKVTGFISKIPVIADQSSQLFTLEVLLPDIDATKVAVGQFVDVMINTKSEYYTYRLPIAALNSIDDEGNALITLINNDNQNESSPNHYTQAFKIIKLSNDYIYLAAQAGSLPLFVVTNGWQKLLNDSATESITTNTSASHE